jgi:hypothetical protein
LGWKLDVIILTYVIDNHLVTPTRSAIASVLRIDDELSKLELIIFGSVRFLLKKVTKLKFFFFLKPKPGQTDRIRFGFLGKKPIQTGSARFLLGFFSLARFLLCFSGLARFWLGLAWFFSGLFFVSVRFFGFLLIKPKPNQTGRFFQNFNRFNRFFFSVWFFWLFFFQFCRFNQFFVFFSPLSKMAAPRD